MVDGCSPTTVLSFYTNGRLLLLWIIIVIVVITVPLSNIVCQLSQRAFCVSKFNDKGKRTTRRHFKGIFRRHCWAIELLTAWLYSLRSCKGDWRDESVGENWGVVQVTSDYGMQLQSWIHSKEPLAKFRLHFMFSHCPCISHVFSGLWQNVWQKQLEGGKGFLIFFLFF